MRIVVGTFGRHVDGCLSGVLGTLTIRSQIELRPVGTSAHGTTYEVVIGSGFVAGHGRSAGQDIDVTVLAPELPGPLRLRAIPPPDGGDEWQLTWDPLP